LAADEDGADPQKVYEANLTNKLDYELFKDLIPVAEYDDVLRLMHLVFNHARKMEDITLEKQKSEARFINVRKSDRVRVPMQSLTSVDITKVKSISNCKVRKGESQISKMNSKAKLMERHSRMSRTQDKLGIRGQMKSNFSLYSNKRAEKSQRKTVGFSQRGRSGLEQI
jgi:hypothetical protein